MSDVVLRVNDLSKSYKTKVGVIQANDNISFELYEDEILAILGPNGAGKSTLIKQIIGYISPDQGSIQILKDNEVVTGVESLCMIGYMMQSRYEHWDHLSVRDAMFYTGRLKKIPKKQIKKEIEYLAEKLELKDELKRPIKTLSGGKKQAAALACSVIGQPSILILDEPTTGLDPEKRVVFWRFLNELKNEKHISIIVITHNVLEIEDIVDRVFILGNARILKEGTPKGLFREVENEIRIELELKENWSQKIIESNCLEEYLCKWSEDGEKLFIYVHEEEMILCISEIFANNVIYEGMSNFQIFKPSLEDVYIKIMGEKMIS